MARLLKSLRAATRHRWSRLSHGTFDSGHSCPFTITPTRSPLGAATSESRSSKVYTLRDGLESEWFDVPSGHHQLHKNLYDPSDFLLYPSFLTCEEQAAILDHCLARLDRLDRHRKGSRTKKVVYPGKFEDEEGNYAFETGHFDEVISGYREMQLNQLKPTTDPSPTSTVDVPLARLQALMPSPTSRPLIHILHLSSQGKIDPHIDNLRACGSTIIGLSLGSTRIMRLGHQSAPIDAHLKVLLPPGSVYIQRDSVRYNLQHSIPVCDRFQDRHVGGEQRLSLILRNEPVIEHQEQWSRSIG